jgi:hypothetical protein
MVIQARSFASGVGAEEEFNRVQLSKMKYVWETW